MYFEIIKNFKKNRGWKMEYGYFNCLWINKIMFILIEYLKYD